MFNLETIKNQFKDTRYKFGYSHTKEKDGYDNISFGIGWGSQTLYSITLFETKIIYKISKADFGRIRGWDKTLECNYSDYFFIPKDEEEFDNFLKDISKTR